MKLIAAIDQGTTSSRAILFDREQNIAAYSGRPIAQYYPKPGWVEHNPNEIYESVKQTLEDAVLSAGARSCDIAAIGITNQRESTLVWEKETGRPITNAICWQCRRTAQLCRDLIKAGYADEIKSRTGLRIDAYFSATKLKWILDNVEGAYKRAQKGELLFGTVDSWLLWNLTGGKIHATDPTNASRTMMFNIHDFCWDDYILEMLDIPKNMLPEVKSSSGVFGEIELYGAKIPISGIAGDQQAALFGEACFDLGEAKNTYGTGCFLLMNTGDKPYISDNGLITTVAASAGSEKRYALEGSVFMGGALIDWLHELGLLADIAQSSEIAKEAKDTGGVYLVPAFTGLGAPYWDMDARGIISGLTRGSNAAQIVRAGLEAIAYQTNDVIEAMQKDANTKLKSLRADGGASENEFLMQFQADISNVEIKRPYIREATALGACYLAGLAVGFFQSQSEIKRNKKLRGAYYPSMPEDLRERGLKNWKKAVYKAMENK